MFNKILIANRGEIACRIARSAREMGVASVAVYSDADRHALHVESCDEAIHIGASAPAESYLQADRIIQTAIQTGANAIHPGFGFLSENADFAEACAAHNIVFIGPGAEAIRSMGSKSAARQIMDKAGVPVLPGYDDDQQDPLFLQQQASEIGYPLLIKAVAGGGGKGLRAVDQAEDFSAALAAVKRESLGAFGDDCVLLERYLPIARHIEIQLFADTHGNVVHLFDRDCSMQRRHQKVIEEAPAPHISKKIKAQMAEAAIACAHAVNYVGAGTVEFLLAPDGAFYFMEMNTRLQVEHPVTEMITGQDLVDWQLKVASGETLPLAQHQIQLNGHAIEARIYAENPEQQFLPSTGRLDYFSPPPVSAHIRIDTGVVMGAEISPWYDPMIAKLICHGSDRQQARLRLRAALSQFDIIGPHNNIRFLGSLCAHPQVIEGGYDTRFIEHHLSELIPVADLDKQDSPSIIAAVLYTLSANVRGIHAAQATTADLYSPWATADNWRVGEAARFITEIQSGNSVVEVSVKATFQALSPALSPSAETDSDATIAMNFSGQHYAVEILSQTGLELLYSIDGIRQRAVIYDSAKQISILIQGTIHRYAHIDTGVTQQTSQNHKGSVLSPMPGKIIACPVKVGQSVQRGEALMVVEAMKMEHSISAAHDGVIEAIHFRVGDQVADGDKLIAMVESDG